MSTQAPQVLSRRANGVLPAPASQANESGKVRAPAQGKTQVTLISDPNKGKGSHENHAPSKPGRGRGSGGKSGDATKVKNATEGDAPKPAKTKPHNEGEKLVIRRLPPGMTQTEFASILGNEWDVGKGRVDWFSYAPGKISNDPSKPSRPGRAYLHVVRKDDIMALNDSVRTSTWEDAKATFNNPSLIGPPAVEFAIYKKIPSNKKRTDARQGTIDQDPEFMAFLEDLANPAPPNQNIDADDADDISKAESKVTTTPLIEYLKEKKANKAKDSAASKNSKGESRGGKGKGGSKDEESTKKRGKGEKGEKSDKAPKETVKILTKKAATEQAAAAAKNAASQIKDSNAQDVPKSRRAGIAAAARILQRDLGLSPGSAHRKARQDAAKADTDTKSTSNKEPAAPAATDRPASPAKPTDAPAPTPKNRSASASAQKSQSQAPGRRTRGGKNSEKNSKATEGGTAQSSSVANPPVVLLKKKGVDTESSRPSTPNAAPQATTQASGSKGASATPSGPKGGSTKSGSSQKKPTTVTPDATRGFVKHANPSQGVTEALLKQSLEIFGTITFVEIDKRKGFAYVDFSEHEGLVKAVSASPITVAQGTVQVLERKDKKPATTAPASGAPASTTAPEKSSGRGRRGRGGGGKGNAANSNQAASNGG
ncbi:hypothetical protein G7Z17_g10840 [Cylindrodendrum hubeiense]|uniref:RRM domain-containing protein n=1 Tax=Cylindrodendrum hubeiense TaxID=595255 RepID=A0A9P5GY55_9HYPO|nr:hypothetical protein G7Z17_g10840 [Cylindrodendrum hubeiense]